MSEQNGHPLDPIEIASLHSQDALRQQFIEQIPESERAHWEAEFALTDRLRQGLADVEIPNDLHDRLMKIPERPVKWSERRIDNRVAAAIFLIVAGLAIYFFFGRQPAVPGPLAASIGNSIATLAAQHNDAQVTVTSEDANVVGKALQASGMDVPVLMLKPTAGTSLVGGGTCDFGGTKAAFTRWKSAAASYTLFEFNGKKLGAPELFVAAMVTPHDQMQMRVFIFPGTGGKCCWALVLENNSASNVFAQYGRPY